MPVNHFGKEPTHRIVTRNESATPEIIVTRAPEIPETTTTTAPSTPETIAPSILEIIIRKNTRIK